MVTANQVTFGRLVFMPVVAVLIYRGGDSLWWAFALSSLVAMTDFVDGYLARKHGPTVFGGLLDPVADKVFLVLTYIPFADLGLFPAWAVAAIFLREFLITGLRSAYAQRDLQLKTSYLAKTKTWVQMQAMAFVLLCLVLSHYYMSIALISMVVGPTLAGIGAFVFARKVWRGAFIMAAFQVGGVLLYFVPSDLATTFNWLCYSVLAVTWMSALDYLVVGLPRLRRAGDFGRADAVRLLASLAVPLLAVAVLVFTGAHVIPLVALLSLELTVGGLDNLLSHHRVSAGAVAWSLRTIGASACLTGALCAESVGLGQYVDVLGILALAISLAGVVKEFWRGRQYYLDALD